ncbi:MAG: purine-nucleoside phosphorylase [Candidatus Sumerlaeia bacterium]
MFDLQKYIAQIREAADFVRSLNAPAPRVGIICGTGMGALANKVADPTIVSYVRIPHFPLSTVESHHGNLVLGRLAGQPVMVMQGRFHFYEGYTMKQVTFPVRVMQELGVKELIIMNAVGSMNPLIKRGSLVLVDDHINMMGDNPLLGTNHDGLGPRFPDMSCPYDKPMRAIAREVAMEAGIDLKEGVLVAVQGPNLETRAEYRMFKAMGADIVSMSTVPEVLVAVHAGIRTIAISTVTDECLPDCLEPAQIDEIIKTACAAEGRLEKLITGILSRM